MSNDLLNKGEELRNGVIFRGDTAVGVLVGGVRQNISGAAKSAKPAETVVKQETLAIGGVPHLLQHIAVEGQEPTWRLSKTFVRMDDETGLPIASAEGYVKTTDKEGNPKTFYQTAEVDGMVVGLGRIAEGTMGEQPDVISAFQRITA